MLINVNNNFSLLTSLILQEVESLVKEITNIGCVKSGKQKQRKSILFIN